MARRSQCSSAGDNPLDPNYLPPHYREEYRLAIDALVEEDLDGYYQFLQKADVVDFLSSPEIQHIQSCVQDPQQSYNTEQHHFLETGAGDGSSDTYWPIHSDLDAPGLDLGWPRLHHFIGPTEVTMLVNPPEPDMPSIKEQARRLIKNAQQVVAIVMDMFTDVDILADILDAAMRNVAVYILLDKQNAHHFVNMVSNCRVNLQSIQLLRVRTVSGITYHCRSGKSVKGQMMDRFLLTDCRAVLSGNYSFMWSFEKLHRCMAHLFLGQLVSTFDEEFRILFAQSHPLIIENFAPMEELSLLQKRPYPGERTLYREPKKFQLLDSAHPEERPRHSYDERVDMDWRMMALKKQESRLGSTDVYGRYTPQQSRMDPPFDPGPSRIPMIENLAFKRHSYAEGAQGRHSYPFLPQGMPEPENQGRPFHRGPQPGPGPGKELDYGGYDKFWNQDFYSADQYSESGLQQDMDQLDNFDPVLNYLSSTRNVDFDQRSEKLLPASDSPIGSPHMRRLSLDQPRAFQTSPTPSNLTEQKQLIQEPNADRKDPMVKRGLRNWRISSYLSACDNPGDEGLPSAPLNAPDPYEETSNPIQQTPGIDLSLPKIPNVREFKVPAIPRVSHIPSYAKTTTREQPKKLPDEPAAVAAEAQTTPTPSESSSSAEVEKTEEAAQKEPKTTGIRREESFRRKYNAAVQRSSRLRSSLIFSSLDTSQDTKTALDQQDDESDKKETEQTKLPFVSQILGQRRSTAREPFEWSRYMKSTSADNSATDPSKPDDESTKQDDKDSAKNKDLKDISAVQESLKPADEEQANPSPSMPRAKAPEAELPKTDLPEQPPVSLLTAPSYIDMSDPDNRLLFFKELAAKRKAAKAAEAEKSKEKALVEPPAELKDTITVKKEEPKETSENIADTSTSDGLLDKNAGGEEAGKTEACESVSLTVDASDKTNRQDSQVKTDPNTSQSCRQEQSRDSADSENGQSAATLHVSAETEAPQSKPAGEPTLSSPALKTSGPAQTAHIHHAPANAPSLAQGTDDGESPRVDSTSKDPGSVEVPPSSALDSNTQNPESFQLETSISTPPLLPEQHTSKPSGQSSSADHILPDSGSKINPSPSPSSCALPSAPAETVSSKVALEDLSSTMTASTSSPDAQESVLPTPPEPSQSTSPETLSAAHSTRVESDISPDKSAAGSEPDSSSLQKKDDDVPESEINSIPADGEESELLGSSKDIKADGAPSSLSPSLPESCLPDASQNEIITPAASPAEAPPKHSETSSPDLTPNASQSERQATPPSQLNLTGSVTKAVSCSSSPTESVGSVLSPEAEKPLTTLHSPSANSSKTPQLPSAETSSPTEPTSKVPAEPDLPCKTPESVTSEPHPPEPPASAENTHMDSQHEVSEEHEMPEPGEKRNGTEATNEVNKTTTQESVCNEKTNEQAEQNNCSEQPEITSDGVVPPSKQPKSSPSRYQSSTANVLSSSNLRDDTKLLLEQISANSQSRNEAAKESPVTDDEKEDEADKNAMREKQRGIGSLHRGEPKTSQEREKLLEKIQSMRKERKVYSRFEMAP